MPGHERPGAGGKMFCPACWKQVSAAAENSASPRTIHTGRGYPAAPPTNGSAVGFICAHCHKRLTHETVNFHEGNAYCPPCYAAACAESQMPMAACHACGSNVATSMMVIFDSKRLCPECFDQARVSKNQEFQIRRQALQASRVSPRMEPPRTRGKGPLIATAISVLLVAAAVVIVVYAVHRGYTQAGKPVSFTLVLKNGRSLELPRLEALEKLASDKDSYIMFEGRALKHEESIQFIQQQ